MKRMSTLASAAVLALALAGCGTSDGNGGDGGDGGQRRAGSPRPTSP